jgi:RNA polymerase sigma factor (sigma-70 family)
MDYPGLIGLLDSNGEPFPDHIQRALVRLLPRLRREFPVLQDDVSLTEVMEEAARRIVAREARGGPIERLHGFAWITLRNIAAKYVSRGSMRVIQETLDAVAGAARLATLPSTSGRVEDIERRVLFAQILRFLSDDEREIVLLRRAGYSSEEIAWVQERTVAAIDKTLSRAKQRIRLALGLQRLRANWRSLA